MKFNKTKKALVGIALASAVLSFPAKAVTMIEADFDVSYEDNNLHNWIARAGLDQSSVNNDPSSNEANWFTGAETVVTVQNKLDGYALGNILETAYVEKKNATVDIVVSTVPVPTAAWLMMTGLGFLTIRNKKGLSAQ